MELSITTAAKVVRVVDGDTIVVLMDGNEEKVRLIGVDTPEIHGGSECYGQDASDFVKQLLVEGSVVQLEKDVNDRDIFERLLRYVFLADGSMLNEALVLNGYAVAKPYPPDTKNQDLFLRAEEQARQGNLGLWSECPKGTVVVSPTPSAVATFVVSLNATSTPVPTATPTYTPTATSTPAPTATPTYTPTATSTPAPTATPTYTPTATSTPAPTATPTYTPTATSTPTPTATPVPQPTSATISVLSYAFSPSDVTISKGGSVTWVFLGGSIPHSSMGTGAESWGSGAMYSGSYSHTFNDTGVFSFVCGFHGSMTGTVTVTD